MSIWWCSRIFRVKSTCRWDVEVLLARGETLVVARVGSVTDLCPSWWSGAREMGSTRQQ